MKLKLITLFFILKIVPSIAQTETVPTQQTDTIALKQVELQILPEKVAPVMTEQQILEIQKSSLENQKRAEKMKTQAEAEAKATDKQQKKLENEKRRFGREQDRISDSEKDLIKLKGNSTKKKESLKN